MIQPIFGVEPIVHRIRQMIRLPQVSPAFYAQPTVRPKRGVLLYGPPGSGKSKVGRSVLEECNNAPKIAFFLFQGSDILEGESCNNLHKLYDAARILAPSVVFFDEADDLLRGTDNGSKSAALTLLSLIDGVPTSGRILTMASTNDDSIGNLPICRQGRLEVKFAFRLPTPEERRTLVTRMTAGWNLSAAQIHRIASQMTWFSHSDIASACNDAAHLALYRLNIQMADPVVANWGPVALNYQITEQDFKEAIKEIKSS